jgi:hypothetical protein
VHAPNVDKNDCTIYKELERVLNQFLEYYLKILVRGLNVRVRGEDVLIPRMGNESLHAICNDNGLE